MPFHAEVHKMCNLINLFLVFGIYYGLPWCNEIRLEIQHFTHLAGPQMDIFVDIDVFISN